jgi:hypothetical protein
MPAGPASDIARRQSECQLQVIVSSMPAHPLRVRVVSVVVNEQVEPKA